MSAYEVYLHGHAGTKVTVEAESLLEANRKALAKAPKVKYVKSWTPVMGGKIDKKEAPK